MSLGNGHSFPPVEVLAWLPAHDKTDDHGHRWTYTIMSCCCLLLHKKKHESLHLRHTPRGNILRSSNRQTRTLEKRLVVLTLCPLLRAELHEHPGERPIVRQHRHVQRRQAVRVDTASTNWCIRGRGWYELSSRIIRRQMQFWFRLRISSIILGVCRPNPYRTDYFHLKIGVAFLNLKKLNKLTMLTARLLNPYAIAKLREVLHLYCT